MKAPWPFTAPKGDGTDVENLPTAEGATLGRELARITERELVKIRERFPDAPPPCDECAFVAGTTPNRSPSTLLDAIKCVVECAPFYCHKGVADGGDPKRVCAGWAAAVTTNPELRQKISEVRK